MLRTVYFLISCLLFPILAHGQLRLLPAERAFLDAHPVLRVAYVPQTPPYEFEIEQQAAGFNVDYLRLLAEQLGVELLFERRPNHKAALEALQNREADLICSPIHIKQLPQNTAYTDPFIHIRYIFIRMQGSPRIKTYADLNHSTLALPAGHPHTEIWKIYMPETEFAEFDSAEQILDAVSSGKKNAAILPKRTYAFLDRQAARRNLRIDDDVHPDDEDHAFRIITRNDWPLSAVFQRAADGLPQTESAGLWKEWFDTELPPPAIRLTSAEKKYITSGRTVRYTAFPNAPPFEYLDRKRQHIGFTRDLMDRIVLRTGLQLEYVPAKTRQEAMSLIETERCDLLLALPLTLEHRRKFLLSKPYADLTLVVATRLDVPFIENLNHLNGPVGIVKRTGAAENLQVKFPDVDFIEFESLAEGLRAVSQGTLTGVVGPLPSVAHQINSMRFGNLKIAGKLDERLMICVALSKTDKTLHGIIDKTLHTIPEAEIQAMIDNWMSVRFAQEIDYRLILKILAAAGIMLFLVITRYVAATNYNRKLRALNKEQARTLKDRDRIMAVISHDLRQPIQGFNLFLDLLENGSVDIESEDGRRMVRQTRIHGERVHESMENLLGWLGSKTKAHHMRIESLPLYDLVEDCRELLHSSIDEKNITIENQVDQKLNILADERSLCAILRNLIANAVKFSYESGKICIGAQPLENNRVQIYIQDRGIGLANDEINAILNGRAGSTLGTAGEKGAGLGLKLCHAFLAQAGSKLKIISIPGEGSTFSFEVDHHVPS